MLIFDVADLRREAQAFKDISSKFIDVRTQHVLDGCIAQLNQHALSADGSSSWEIRMDNPLRSIPSRGEYEPGGEGGMNVYAQMTFIWQIRPARHPGESTKLGAKRMAISGIASTLISVRSCEDDQEHAMWRMEVASPDGPGAFFHVQVLGQEASGPFPKSMPVPRFPSVLNTPFAAMEFALGELFQDEWARRAQQDRTSRNWGKIQRKRHSQHLKWALSVVDNANGSPWSAWKAAKPSQDLFLR